MSGVCVMFSLFLMIRKSNNQLIKRTDQKLKDLPQMAGHPVRHQAQRPPTAKNPQKQQRRPVGQRTPAEEEESRVSGGLKMLVTSGHHSVGLNTGTVFMTWGFPWTRADRSVLSSLADWPIRSL